MKCFVKRPGTLSTGTSLTPVVIVRTVHSCTVAASKACFTVTSDLLMHVWLKAVWVLSASHWYEMITESDKSGQFSSATSVESSDPLRVSADRIIGLFRPTGVPRSSEVYWVFAHYVYVTNYYTCIVQAKLSGVGSWRLWEHSVCSAVSIFIQQWSFK